MESLHNLSAIFCHHHNQPALNKEFYIQTRIKFKQTCPWILLWFVQTSRTFGKSPSSTQSMWIALILQIEWLFGTTTHLEKRIWQNSMSQGLEHNASQPQCHQQIITQWRSIENARRSTRSPNWKQQNYRNMVQQHHVGFHDKYVPYRCVRRYHQLATKHSKTFPYQGERICQLHKRNKSFPTFPTFSIQHKFKTSRIICNSQEKHPILWKTLLHQQCKNYCNHPKWIGIILHGSIGS